MTKITLSLEDSKVKQLRDKAESYGLKLEQFVTASIDFSTRTRIRCSIPKSSIKEHGIV